MEGTRKNRPDLWKKEKEIVDLYIHRGLVPSKIGKMFNCNKTTIHTILKSNEIKLDRKRARNVWKNKKEIVDKYINKNIPVVEIAKEFNCNFATIYRILNQNNVEVKRNKRFWDKQNEIIKKYNEGMSVEKIYKVMGCKSRTIITQILEKNNIKIRPQGIYLLGKEPPNKLVLPEKEIIEMYTSKKIPGNKICKKFKCSYSPIYRILKKEGVNIKGSKFFNKGKHYSPKTEFQKGENHIYFNNWSSKEPYGVDFNRRLKKFIKERDGDCMLCKVNFEDLKILKRQINVHHINYDKKCNLPQNLITLCNSCHQKTNFDREIWTKHFQELLSKLYDYQYSETGEIILELNNKIIEV